MGDGPMGIMVLEDVGAAAGCARALEHVANRPIAHHVLDVLVSAGVEDIIVASSPALASEIRRSLASREDTIRARVRYVERRGRVDLAAALSVAEPFVGNSPCIVHLGCGLLDEPLAPLRERLRSDSPDATVLVHQRPATDGHLSAATQTMLHVAELDPEHAALSMAGVWLFGPDALRHLREVAWREGGFVDLTNVAGRIASAGGNFDVLLAEWREYAGDPLDLLELNRIALDRMAVEQVRPYNNGNQIEGRVRIDESAVVRGSVIAGPAVIGPKARVCDAYIGPYTSIGPGARIEGSEIERSIVSAGASIMHVGGRMVASVVGRNTRVFRDFSLPRALRLRVGEGTEVALS